MRRSGDCARKAAELTPGDLFCVASATESAVRRSGVLDPPNTRSWRDDPRPESGLPSDRHPDRTKRAVVLEAVKVWPGKTRVCRKVGVTANLDSSCARRLCNTAGRGEETGLQAEQRNRSRKMRALKPLDKKRPIQGGMNRQYRRGSS